MKKILVLLLFGLLTTPLSMSAQNTAVRPYNTCGTSMEAQEVLYNEMVELRKRYPNVTASRAISYVPVWFHMVALSNGTGRTTEGNVADMVCAWNKLYEDNGLEIQFYIKGFSNIDLDALYNTPQSFAGTNRMLTTRRADAMNVYLTKDAGDGSRPNEIVLAYYAPTDGYDWIVCSISQVNGANATTIAHEAGHFFSLPHTFYGWEGTGAFDPTTAAGPCAPATVSYGGRSILVEKVARTGPTKNCDVAADGFCDTAEDYYLGFSSDTRNCVYAGIAKDPDCVAINPDEPNIMGYFSCPRTFSTEQKNAIRNNYSNSSKRAYIRAGNITPPLTSTIATLISPAAGTTTAYYNNIQLDWNDVPNAFGYSVDVSRFASFSTVVKNFYVTTSELNVNALNAGTILGTSGGVNIYWRVRAVVPYKNCDVATSNFRTSTLSAVNEITGVTRFTVSPNPLSKTENLSLQMTSETAFDANIKLFSTIGQLVKTERRQFTAGYSTQVVSIADLTNGTYILTVESEKGVLNKRVVIQ